MADVRTLDAVVAKAIARPRFDTFLLGVFAIVALILASVGLYGVMNYSTTQRTHEIGIRMALGASRSQIMRLVLGDGMSLTFIGILLGLAGSVALTRVMESFLFGVSPTDAMTFVGVARCVSASAESDPSRSDNCTSVGIGFYHLHGGVLFGDPPRHW